MGRFLFGGSGAAPRSLRQVFENSNPSFSIPSWARFMRVSGVGGGGSGGIRAVSGSRGSGGASGFQANQLPLVIPSMAGTIAVAIGAAGAAPSASAATNGNAGGDTTLTIGGILALRLRGGGGGLSGGASPPSTPENGAILYPQLNATHTSSPMFNVATQGAFGSNLAASPHLYGSCLGFDGTNAGFGFGAGASSLFGRGGDGIASSPTANTNGGNATGYGAGGAGALWLSGGSVTSGSGSHGILICEFLEALP